MAMPSTNSRKVAGIMMKMYELNDNLINEEKHGRICQQIYDSSE
jgi:hypothetical protein